MHTGISCCRNAALPLLAGVACFAFVCGGFWVVKSQTRRYLGFAEEREDRISQLPDDVISLIISRLRTRDAVRTSVLSRRWRHVYTFINEVRFRCSDMYKHKDCLCGPNRGGEKLSRLRRKFAEGVDTFLQRHSGSKLTSFELVCCFRGFIPDSFRKWMSSVGTLGVEQLTLGCCSLPNPLGSDHPVFSTDFLPQASSVKHLWLRGGSFLTPNKNALKVLELDFIAFTSQAVESILSNCSGLQILSLRYCVLPSKLRIHGSDLQLKSLMICQCKNVTEIDLSATNLITFELVNLKILTLSFSHVPLLQNLVIEFHGGVVTPCVFGKIAKDPPHLESLVFKNYTSFFYVGREVDQVINKLSNLRQLVLILEYYNELDLLELVAFLDACPLLHKFQLSMLSPSTIYRHQARERVVRRDTRLKEVEFHGFRETESEYNFILYILKTVASLERFVISRRTLSYIEHLRRSMAGEIRHQIIRERLQVQAISKNVEIIIL